MIICLEANELLGIQISATLLLINPIKGPVILGVCSLQSVVGAVYEYLHNFEMAKDQLCIMQMHSHFLPK